MADCFITRRGGGKSGGGNLVVYGAEWAGSSSPIWTRTYGAALFADPVAAVNNGNGSSPFDTIMPWAGMVREERAGGTMVKIPKYWYKWTREGAKMKLQITPNEELAHALGFYTAPAHADRGDGKGERDFVYIGAFHCGSDYKSKTGVMAASNRTRADFRSGIHSLGANIWQCDFAMYWTWAMLYLVEYANWNSQAVIGYGGSDNGSRQNNGLCDDMIYHTGTNAASRTTYGHTRYRYIEGLWDNGYDWCDGIYFAGTSKKDVYCIKNPANFSDDSNGILVGTRYASGGGGLITEWTNPSVAGFEYALYPSNGTSTNINYDTYVCDYCDYYSLDTVLSTGGHYSQSQSYGAFGIHGNANATDAGPQNCGRIMELP